MRTEPAHFLINKFHAYDHTKSVSPPQCDAIERIRAVNTSPGECGHRGLGRIRKSVSFTYAVIYMKTMIPNGEQTYCKE